MRFQEVFVERLDQVRKNRCKRGSVKEYDLIHRERAAAPSLVNFSTPDLRREILQRRFKDEVLPLRCFAMVECGPPQCRLRVSRIPLTEERVMQLVGADKVRDRPKGIDFGAKLWGQLYRRPDPMLPTAERRDQHPSWIGKAIKVDVWPISQLHCFADRRE